ncbi:glycosyltransferase [Photobacterium leiognathi]|uniref:glycosyltransferase n=1 Tax=Photobacterium leiognathi TaxID=553611 RepID=UPI002981E20A|nr:glycosyltransferase [Photobacterium leiognathi]
MKVVFICDHSLDPRLRNRVKWFKNIGYDIEIYVDSSRGGHFSDSIYEEKNINDLNRIDISSIDLFYISGAKIIIMKLLLFIKLKFTGSKVIYEIPDLPLRSHNFFVNKAIEIVFNKIIGFLFKNIVVTSDGFLKKLPINKNYYLCENIPQKQNANILLPKVKSDKLRIAFIGSLRYQKQMLMLIRYCIDSDYIAIFYGGPKEEIDKLKLLCNENSYNIDNNIIFKGEFKPSDLERIYSTVDFVYSVYDSLQPNVRMALPNKLYEAQLFRTPIIVSSNTYLSEIVNKEAIGFSVDSLLYDNFKHDMDKGLNRRFKVTQDHIIYKIKTAESDFKNWMKAC